MAKRMLIDALHSEETRVAIADELQIYDFDFVSTAKKQLKGNIYLAKVTRVEPSLQAAFVEYGGGKQGFLPFAEIHTDYYQIPFSDREKLMAEVAGEAAGEPIANEQPSENNAEISPEEQLAAEESVQDATAEEQESRPAYLVQGNIEISESDEEKLVDALLPSEQETEQAAVIEQETSESPAPISENAGAEAAESISEPASEEVETVATDAVDEVETGDGRKRNVFMRRYKIQEVIRRGQVILVQVIKEERGNKGVSLTTYLSLAGRYCVLMPNSPKDGGISRKIASVDDRKRLKAISTEFRLAEGMSVIIRTAGMERTHAEIKRDFDYLVNLWNIIREETLKSNAPALIYEESDIVKRAIRDQYSSDIDEIVVEGEAAFKSARDFMKLLMPSHTAKIKHYQSPTPIFYHFGIEDQLLSMHEPVVKMKSGAYLVINPTEALISIDVNSGRATGERNIEETALKTNLEAAAEVARQLRLRDLAGLVVIDFIDMVDSRNRRAVEKMLKDSMRHDRAKIQLGRISPFGLLEMSRQRLRPSISETSMMECPHCAGRGNIRSNESMAIQIIRAIEKEASSGNAVGVRVLAPQTTALYMLNSKRDALRELENRYDVSIQILINPELSISDFAIEKIRKGQGDKPERADNENRRPPRRERPERQERPERTERPERKPREAVEEVAAGEAGAAEEAPVAGETAIETTARKNRNRRRGRRGGRGNNSEVNNSEITADNVIDFPSETAGAESTEPTEKPAPKERGERGGRGRRNWRDRGGEAKSEAILDDAPTSWNGGAAALAADAKELPAFATDNRPAAIPAPPVYKPFHDHKPEAAVAAPVAQPAPQKRGWWQKMISLDD